MFDILIYRLFRLRRTIVLGIVPSLATVCAMSLIWGETYPVLVTLAIFLPLAHAVSYPNAWTETLTVSLALSACLALAATMPEGIALEALLVRVGALIALFFLLFFVFVSPMATLATLGPRRDTPVRAVMDTHLPADKLRKTLTYYPGRDDHKVTCGEADADGRFSVTSRIRFDTLNAEFDVLNVEPDGPEMEGENGANKDEIDFPTDGVLECHGHAVISSTGPDHHEIFFVDHASGLVTVCKYGFDESGRGTRVTLEEAGVALTWGERFGMWVSDYLADYLTDCIDAAEGRPARANRAFSHSQFVVDLANILVPWLDSQCVDEPTDRRS